MEAVVRRMPRGAKYVLAGSAESKHGLPTSYGGRELPGLYETEDVVHDPDWQSAKRDWEMRLMDFRVIHREGPNRCRW
jgi:hypothetical protein